MAPEDTGIVDCHIVPVSANRDARGCLYEIYRVTWPNAFPTVQWNACASNAGVVRGAHVHVDYHEFYTLPRGRVIVALADIRRESPTFGRSVQFEWTDRDACAIVVPMGVAHVVRFQDDSVLAFGLSDFWKGEYDVAGCQWDDPELGFVWSDETVVRSKRDRGSGSYQTMVQLYEKLSLAWRAEKDASVHA